MRWSRLRNVAPLAALLVCFLALGGAYVYVVPLWETPDEPSNVSTAIVASRMHRVPTPLEQPLYPGVTLNAREHPPLFFALMGVVFAARPALDPHIEGSPFGAISAEVARYQHDGGLPADRFDDAWFLRGVRGISVMLGAATLVVVWRTASLVMPGSLLGAFLSAGLFGLIPTFIFSHASIDPLPLSTLAASLVVLHMLGLNLRARTGVISMRTLGVLLIIAIAIRTSLVFLYLPAFYLVWRERGRRLALMGHLAAPAVIGLVWLLVLSPGPTFQAFRHVGSLLLRVQGSLCSVSALKAFVLHTKNSFWARFGWADLYAPARLIDIFDVLSLVTAAGWVVIIARRTRLPGVAFLAGTAAVGIVGYAKANLAQFDPQGRYLVLLIAAYAPLGAAGLREILLLLRVAWLRRLVVGLIAGVVLGANVYCLASVIYPAYGASRYQNMALDAYQEHGALIWSGSSAGQTFIARRPGLTRVEFYFTPDRHTPRRTLEFRLMESPLIPEPLAIARVPYPSPRDRPYTGFTFLPRWDSENRSYHVRVSVVPQGDPVNVWYTLEDRYIGGSRYADGLPTQGDLRFTAYYRVPPPAEPVPEPEPE